MRLQFTKMQGLGNDFVVFDAIRHAYFREQLVVEGSGSVGIAALLAGLVPGDDDCAVVLSGRNIDMSLHRKIINDQPLE